MRFLQFIAAAWLVLTGAAAPVHAEKRVALVIGNDRYANLPGQQLRKAVSDARAVGAALQQIGFEVITGENLGRGALVDKLDELTRRLVPGDTAFFFFSGHGVALDGVNYILPADVPDIAPGQETRMKLAALGEADIIAGLTGRDVRVAVVVLDACRNNPFKPSRPGLKGVGVEKGLAPPPQVRGVFSLYAAGIGQGALDQLYDGDANPNSVFSRVLVPSLTQPGLDLTALAVDVRQEVARIAQSVGHDQQPAYHDGLTGRFYLAEVAAEKPGTPPPAGAPAPAPEAVQAWAAVQNAPSLAVIDDFIRHFGNAPVYGALAQALREELANRPPLQPEPRPAETAKEVGRTALRVEQPRHEGASDRELDAAAIAAAVAIDSEGERNDLLGTAQIEMIDVILGAKMRLPHLSIRQIVAKALSWIPDDWEYSALWQDRDPTVIERARSETVKGLIPLVLKRMERGPANGCAAKFIRAKFHLWGHAGGEGGAIAIIRKYPKDPRLENKGLRTDFRCLPERK